MKLTEKIITLLLTVLAGCVLNTCEVTAANETAIPSLMPSNMPSNKPSNEPSNHPSENPSRSPSKYPSIQHSENPSASPTIKASMNPSIHPSIHPSRNPSMNPSRHPSMLPSRKPSVEPSLQPSNTPSMSPSVNPTAKKTPEPTSEPTLSPTSKPTSKPTVQASSEPSLQLSMNPSAKPSLQASLKPTVSISQSPSLLLPSYGPLVETGITMTLTGKDLQLLDTNQLEQWQNQTSNYIQNYFLSLSSSGQKQFSKVDIQLKVNKQESTSEDGADRRNLRDLQVEKYISLTYTQTTNYRSNQEVKDYRAFFVEEPFLVLARRNNYINNFLKQITPQVQTITIPILTTIAPTPAPTPTVVNNSSSSSNQTPIFAGAAAGAGLLIFLIIGIVWYTRRKNQTNSNSRQWDNNDKPDFPMNELPSQLQIQGLQDEVSTLAEPHPSRLGAGANESLPEYGEGSVATVDYDYSGAYGGGGSIISSVGGTMGDSTTRGGKSSTGPVSTQHSHPSLLNDNVYNAASFANSNNQQPSKQQIDVFAPPGKLGVVIDTPDSGAPVVHAIKETSPIGDKLQVGDKLLAVDDESVRNFSAIKVSKLISRKSTNSTRKLTILRTIK